MRPWALALVLLSANAHAERDSVECLGFAIPRGYHRIVSRHGRAAVLQSATGYRLGSGTMWPSFTIEIEPANGLPLISIDNASREAIAREGSDFGPIDENISKMHYGAFTVRRFVIDGVPASRWEGDDAAEMFGAPIRVHDVLVRLVIRDRLYAVAAGWNVSHEKVERAASDALLRSLTVMPACR